MFHIAICEDECIFSNAHCEVCHNILENLKVEHQISIFASSTDFITAFITQQQRFDMILLDIVMDGVNGLELARRIRQKDEDVAIIFITAYDRFAVDGYDVKALRYIMKPVDIQLLEDLIRSVYKDRFLKKVLIIKSGENYKCIPIKEIICLEIAGRHVEITLTNGVERYSGKLSDILNELQKGQFIQCHQAFAVNIKNIREISRRSAIAVNGKEIPVSRTYWNNIKNAFLKKLDDD